MSLQAAKGVVEMQHYKPGALVVYRMPKISTHPGPRAKGIAPAPKGETYSYEVDKYWVVADSLSNGALRILTRRGKEHTVDSHDPRLRLARWWERIFFRSRFPSLPHQGVAAGAN